MLAFVLQLAGPRCWSARSRRWRSSRSFPLRHAVLHLSRPGNQTRVILLAVGLGAFFIVGVRSLQASLLEEFSIQRRAPTRPDMFLMDIQRDQADGVRAFLADPAHGAGAFRLIPVLRARVTGVERPRDAASRASRTCARAGRSPASTPSPIATTSSRTRRSSTARSGTDRRPEAEVSVEEGMHERFSIDVGDTMRFDILGRIINARVTSIREVDWRDSRNGGFMFVFRPGRARQAPQTFIAPLKGPDGRRRRARGSSTIWSQQFPNVSVIDFHEILDDDPRRHVAR